MGFSSYMTARYEKSLADWPRQMAKGPTRFVVQRAAPPALLFAAIMTYLVQGDFPHPHSTAAIVGEVASQFLVLFAFNALRVRDEWYSVNLAYFQRTGDETAAGFTQKYSTAPPIPIISMIVSGGVAITALGVTMAWSSRAPLLWAVTLLAGGLTLGLAAYFLRRYRERELTLAAHLHPGPVPDSFQGYVAKP